MKFLNTMFVAVCLFVFASCGLEKYNNSDPKKIKNLREGNIYVYGIKGDSARQLRQDYPANKEADQRAKAIRAKFFGSSEGSNLQDGMAVAVVDTTNNTKAADTAKQAAQAEPTKAKEGQKPTKALKKK